MEILSDQNIYFDLFIAATLMCFMVLLAGKFEAGQPMWRRIMRAVLLIAGTGVLSYFFGHWSLVYPLGMTILGGTFHIWWCRKNGIDPITAEPYELYRKLRGWK